MRREPVWILFVSFFLLLSACSNSEGSFCLEDDDCSVGEFCETQEEICVVPCSEDFDCDSLQCNLEEERESWCEPDEDDVALGGGGGTGDRASSREVAEFLGGSDTFIAAIVTMLATVFIDQIRGPVGQSGGRGRDGDRGPEGLQGPEGPAGPPGDVRTLHTEHFTLEASVAAEAQASLRGVLEGRALTFIKEDAQSDLRVAWYDMLGTEGQGCSCLWGLRFDGAACTEPGPIGILTTEGVSAQTVSGWCRATEEGPLGAGEVTVSVEVEAGAGDEGCGCVAGLRHGEAPVSAGHIEAEER